MEFKKALKRIQDALMQENETSYKDWKIIFNELVGRDDAETITNVQKFVKDNFFLKSSQGQRDMLTME